MSEQNTDAKSLAHTRWNCKYHGYLHQSIEEKYSSKKRERISEK